MKGMTHEESAKFRNAILEYRKDGHTLTETAEHFGVRKNYVTMSCRGVTFPVDIEACRAAGRKAKSNQWGKIEDRERNAARLIEERTPQFEYIGGYTGSEGYADIKCKKCGSVLHKSMVSIRHGKTICEVCEKRERDEKERKEREERKAAQIKRHTEAVERNKARKEERDKIRESKKHPCVVCGTITTNKYCCSVACSERRNNQIKEVRRRDKIADSRIDRGITLQRVYAKDDGVCYICGGKCNWEDRVTTGDTVVCGNNYPSIDHVIPLAKGGMHEWSNVRLAHRICNSKKSASLIPLGQK